MQSQDNQKKYKKEIIAVIAVAAVCIIVALTFVIQYAVRTYKEEKMIEELTKLYIKQFEKDKSLGYKETFKISKQDFLKGFIKLLKEVIK